ncbi:major facilitator superfamily domain-containing protein [Alternaria rosae]|uniref:major facilitator superfamily domain-containing protein n=1 Tax=Alternaria rosae TaxID=1187941 RepID=UPI001E8D8FE2|nr:major facilitator superfamily domain-containing protein [Alternaria rosae]KAH6872381.1 major facilitator superfamily domain-containing protein [Alternaria rosae]
MGLGILSDHALEQVPGTAQVLEGEQRREIERNAGSIIGRPGLKYDKTGTILLVPQPSDDPNDPLNWSLRRRDTILFLLSVLSVIASTLSPILAANTVSLAIYFGRNLTDMALLTGYHLLGVGVAGFLFVPSARIWGKRHVYLLGNVVVVVSCVWGGAIGNHYAGFLWARVFQGVGLAPFEALVNASVGDMYHVHERGVRMALSNFCVFGGAFLTPVLVGVIADRIGYQWTFYFVAIFAGIMLPLVILYCPETAFRREEKFDIDTMGNLLVKDGEEMKILGNRGSSSTSAEHEAAGNTDEKGTGNSPDQQSVGDPPRKATLLESMKPFNGRKTDERYLHLLLRPFSLFLHPGILWACLIQGTLIGFTVLIGVVLAAIMLGPPLWFGEVETGYMYTGGFIGALLGFALTGLISDWSANLLTRLNNGVYEPEFRMVLVIPQMILGCAGIYGFGWTSADAATYGWFWPDFFFALVVMGMVCGAVASALYIVDAHRGMSIEAFTCLLVFKNVFSFGLTFKGFDWIVDAGRRSGAGGGGGIKGLFIAVGSVQVAICALTIPMYILGKRNRSFFHRHNVFFAVTDWVADKLTFW